MSAARIWAVARNDLRILRNDPAFVLIFTVMPLAYMAFNRRILPHGIQLNAVFASDVSHWDVPDMREVLSEAWELVDDGHLGKDEFRAFSFGNIVDMLTATNPGFFRGTVVEGAVDEYLASRE